MADVAEKLALELTLKRLAFEYQAYGKDKLTAYYDITEAWLHLVAEEVFPVEEFFLDAIAASVESVVISVFGEQNDE